MSDISLYCLCGLSVVGDRNFILLPSQSSIMLPGMMKLSKIIKQKLLIYYIKCANNWVTLGIQVVNYGLLCKQSLMVNQCMFISFDYLTY